MNRSKLAFALLAVAIAVLGYWLWSSRADERQEFAAPVPASSAAKSGVELEPKLATQGLDETRQAAREAASTRETTPKASTSLRDFAVRGHVLARGTRVPIAGADIALCDGRALAIADSEGEPFARSTSDEQGAFEIALVGGAPSKFALLATHEDFAPTWLDTLQSDAGDIELDVELDTHFFIGVDVWAPGGRATVAGAEMQLASSNPAFREEALHGESDARGHFEFEVTGLPRTDLELIVGANECAPWLLRGLTLEPGVQRRNVICNLEQPRGIHGRVIDALRKKPIEGAELEICGQREDFESGGGEARSDEHGNFAIDLRDCPVEFASVYVRAKGFRATRVDRLEQYAHDNAADLLVELSAPMHLRGKLRASDGQPVPENSIEVAPSNLWVDASDAGGADAGGGFDFFLEQVPAGPARITCQADGCVSKAFDIDVTESTKPLDITLERALRLHGQVLRASDSRPLPDVRVRLLAANGASWITFSNAAGQYEFYAAPKDVVGARLMIELGGRRLAVSELPAVRDQLELVHDITVALVAPAKAR